MAAVGAGNWKPVPGPVVLRAIGDIVPEGVLLKWQLSHLVVVGKCELGPGLLLEGITTMLLTP